MPDRTQKFSGNNSTFFYASGMISYFPIMGLIDRLFGNANKKELDLLKDLQTEEELFPGIKLPRLFAPYRDRLEKYRQPYLSIKAIPVTDTALNVSSFFNPMRLPKDIAHPVDREGKSMLPLAQINFSECPKLDGFPETGYLQFYIAADEAYGLNFDDPSDTGGFRVHYFTEEELKVQSETDRNLAIQINKEFSPGQQAHKLHFELKTDLLSSSDYSTLQLFDTILEDNRRNYPGIADKLDDMVYLFSASNGHKLGGLASFTQTDPREYQGNLKEYILLFQMDSDDYIMWGDVGIANFFIKPEDLARLDFSNVIYNWDCG